MATTPYDPFRINNVASEVQRPAQQLAGCGKGNEAPVIPPGYKQTDMGVFPKHWQVVDVGAEPVCDKRLTRVGTFLR